MKSPLQVEFAIPDGFLLPEGHNSPGSEFDLVCSFKIKKDKKLCLTQLGTFDMPGYEDKDDPEPTRYGRAREQMVGEAAMEG